MFGKTSLPKHSLTFVLGSEGDQSVKEVGMSRKKLKKKKNCLLRDKRHPCKQLCRRRVSCQPSGFYCAVPNSTAWPNDAFGRQPSRKASQWHPVGQKYENDSTWSIKMKRENRTNGKKLLGYTTYREERKWT